MTVKTHQGTHIDLKNIVEESSSTIVVSDSHRANKSEKPCNPVKMNCNNFSNHFSSFLMLKFLYLKPINSKYYI